MKSRIHTHVLQNPKSIHEKYVHVPYEDVDDNNNKNKIQHESQAGYNTKIFSQGGVLNKNSNKECG
ncbi:unnamed protein product [Trifolium pratense]|uniref:Uncharacterized protein n=1 Tax=Trifolium pratense TaxID=57577 RepID=A0ACB0KUL3_TRIPR|nr:unnamed protein product [Trifolium pratense]